MEATLIGLFYVVLILLAVFLTIVIFMGIFSILVVAGVVAYEIVSRKGLKKRNEKRGEN